MYHLKKKYIITALAVPLIIVAVVVVCAYYGSIPGLSPALRGESKVLMVQSTSMEPAIKKGASIVYDDTVPFSSLKIDNIVVFRGESNLIVSRIVNQGENEFQVKGDANSAPYYLNATQESYVGKW